MSFNEVRFEENIAQKSMTISVNYGGEREAEAIIEAIREGIVRKLVDKYIENFGEEIIASIDIEAITKKTSAKITTAAIKQLVKEN